MNSIIGIVIGVGICVVIEVVKACKRGWYDK